MTQINSLALSLLFLSVVSSVFGIIFYAVCNEVPLWIVSIGVAILALSFGISFYRDTKKLMKLNKL